MSGPPTRPPTSRVVRLMRPQPELVELRRPEVRRAHPPSPVIVLWGLLALIVVGTVLLLLPFAAEPGQETGLLTALFTATSAVCVTGLVVVDTQEHWSFFGEAVVLALIFVGGLGFLTSSTLILLLIGRRLSLRDRLLVREAVGEGTLGGIVALVQRIVLFALGVQAAGAVLLTFYWLGLEDARPGVAAWYGLFHAVSAFNNAGFDLLGGFRSLTGHQDDAFLLLVISALIVLGGISYAVVADVGRERRFDRLALDTKLVLVVSGLLLLIGTVMVLLLERPNADTLGTMRLPTALLHSFFFSVTARTAGFASVNPADFRDETLFFLMGLMFVGGAAGSTAGGIKVNSLAVLLAAVFSASMGRSRVVAFQREMRPAVVMRSLTVAFLGLGIVMNVALALTIVAAFQFVDVLFEATSAFGTVGLSTGITPELPAAGKLTLIVAMFLGRLGPLTLAFALARHERESALRFPEDAVRIG